MPAGQRVYAIGDIHGRSDLLVEMIGQIEADLLASPVEDCQIVTLGDYTDRGPDTCGVIETLSRMAGSPSGPRIICLRGNHDQWVLDFLEDPFETGEHWMRWGGRETLTSYGVEPRWETHPHQMARDFRRALPRKHLQFLRETKFCHDAGSYFFAHAGVRPGVPLEQQLPDDLMWIRDPFLLSRQDFGKVVIHGHTPHDHVDIHVNRINADTRAFESGILSCVVLEGDGYRLLEVCGDPGHWSP